MKNLLVILIKIRGINVNIWCLILVELVEGVVDILIVLVVIVIFFLVLLKLK